MEAERMSIISGQCKLLGLLGFAIFLILTLVVLFSKSSDISGGRVPLLSLPSKTFDRTSKNWPSLKHLIIVPGNAIQWCTEHSQRLDDERCWQLFDFQRGQVPVFLEHIKRGVEMASLDKESLLVMSGGQTRPGIGPRSEGQSYFSAAEHLNLFTPELFDRATTEEFARDSLENLVYSMCRFRQMTGALPVKVSVVGFPFKARRFIDLHRQAGKLSPLAFHYVGVNIAGQDYEKVVDSAYEEFKNDIYGCGLNLVGKRATRNPYHQHNPYTESCPELQSVLKACL